MSETVVADVLVIGGGGAAARAAVEAARSGASVALVDKGIFGATGSSPTSLHGLAAPIGEGDSPELLFSDLIADGYHMSDQNLAWAAAQGATENYQELERLGYAFLRKKDGSYAAYKGIGHSAHRGLQYLRQATGLDPVAMLGRQAWRLGVKLCDQIMITRLLKQDNSVVGAVGVSQDGKGYLFQAKAVVLAAGGANHLYSNPCRQIADRRYRTTGAAFWLAFDVGAPLIDLEFANFREGEGTMLPKVGAHMFNARGERIMERYAPQMLERAPRGKLVEAIYRENQAGRGPVYWQLPQRVDDEYQGEVERLKQLHGQRFEPAIDFQRLLGGARINEQAGTSIAGLFAAGESAGGFHGADRMQAAAFLEVTFFGARAGINAAQFAQNHPAIKVGARQVDKELSQLGHFQGNLGPEEVIASVQNIMWQEVSIVRHAEGMNRALAAITEVRQKKLPQLSGKDVFASLEAGYLALTAEMVTRVALKREETRGTHRRSDYPEQDDTNWLKHVAIYNKKGEMLLDTLPVVTIPRPGSHS